MADDEQPTPDEPTPAPKRGAGWDDDEWVRRDLGPRPEVPGHGARPVLMGIPILLIAIAAIAAIVIAGGGDDDTPTATTPSGSASAGTGDAATERAEAALRSASTGLAGRADTDIYADATCEPTDSAGVAGFSCAFGGEGDPDSGTVVIRLQDDGTVTKVIGSAPPVAGLPSSSTTQALLTEDDVATGASKVTYACATSTAVNPDGTSAGTTGTGQRCALVKVNEGAEDEVVGQRYVEFAADGTVRRDFMLPTS